MSLAAFQRAMVDMSASVELCMRIQKDADAVLAGYDLTPLERERLAAAANQAGMKINCMIYRSNRLGPINAQLPGTCHLLGGKGLRAVAEGFWVEHPVPLRNAPTEVRAFAAYVRRQIDAGAVAEPLLPEVLAWEMETYELALLPPGATHAAVAAAGRPRPDGPLRLHPLVGLARFSREPGALVAALQRKRPLPYDDIPAGDFPVLVDLRGDRRAMALLPPSTAEALHALRAGAALPIEAAEALIEQGLAVAA